MNETTTQLLTLLNVSALKRKRPIVDPTASTKLNKRKKSVTAAESNPLENAANDVQPDAQDKNAEEEEDRHSESGDIEQDPETLQTTYKQHFGPETKLLSESARTHVDEQKLTKSVIRRGKLGALSLLAPEESKKLEFPDSAVYREFRTDILSTLSRYQDLFITRTELEYHSITRDATTLHALNHVFNIRRRVLKNNDRISRSKIDTTVDPPPDIQDQGFTRPSVLILAPFRNSALQWANSILAHLPSHQVENRARLVSEFSLPEGAIDKLAEAEPGTYPADHVEMFKGNVDDNFRVGVKVTKKAVKWFAGFYQCDIIIASPLGLRMIIEKDKNADFLSSIEVLIVDKIDALTMQNWEHVRFIFDRLNQLPKEAHDADFSRIKPWYLDGHAAYLRQSILLSSYETPEMRTIFNHQLKNVAGKLKTEKRWKPVAVPEGVDQKFSKFDCATPKSEPDKRFDYFTKQILPSVFKSAVQSVNTLIFVPSSFDFIRLQNYFRKLPDPSVAILSEYSSNADISRARQAFFNGKKRFLIMSERFHFFRRYKIRGIRNIIFYALPEHPQFYTELLSFPFLDEGVEPGDVTCRTVYCKYDAMRLDRIVGSEAVAGLIQG
ncbi:hypothetical protein M422DRAFT_57837 [Sphaerobolus stellatus SS14]|nr:hypothetical protein M422DRAFT_57837 [Sphaerobolus stellatus SS14]